MLVSSVHPVAVLSAVFCIVCSLFMFVSDVMGDQMVLAYSIMGRVIVLYVVISVSFVFPQCVVVSDLSMFSVGLALSIVFLMCFVYVNFGSNVRPSILGSRTVGSGVLFICRCSVVLYSAGSGVKSVDVVLDGLSVSWLFVVQLCI